jgi:hypothetical protein
MTNTLSLKKIKISIVIQTFPIFVYGNKSAKI